MVAQGLGWPALAVVMSATAAATKMGRIANRVVRGQGGSGPVVRPLTGTAALVSAGQPRFFLAMPKLRRRGADEPRAARPDVHRPRCRCAHALAPPVG